MPVVQAGERVQSLAQAEADRQAEHQPPHEGRHHQLHAEKTLRRGNANEREKTRTQGSVRDADWPAGDCRPGDTPDRMEYRDLIEKPSRNASAERGSWGRPPARSAMRRPHGKRERDRFEVAIISAVSMQRFANATEQG